MVANRIILKISAALKGETLITQQPENNNSSGYSSSNGGIMDGPEQTCGSDKAVPTFVKETKPASLAQLGCRAERLGHGCTYRILKGTAGSNNADLQEALQQASVARTDAAARCRSLWQRSDEKLSELSVSRQFLGIGTAAGDSDGQALAARRAVGATKQKKSWAMARQHPRADGRPQTSCGISLG